MKVTRLRHDIYLMLLEGSYAAEVSKNKHLKHQTVQYHIKTLEHAGIVARKGGKSYPQFYEKGPNATTFEEASSRLTRDCKDDGRGVTTKQKSRTHAKGCVITLVTRVGELHRIPTGDGPLDLFPEHPYNAQHGNEFFKGTLPIDGHDIKVQFQRTERGSMLFYVWPPQVEQAAGDLSYCPPAWKECNEWILNLLSKYGGWRFGPARSFSGETHFAVSEDAWFDRSTGILESETTNLRKAWLWLNIDQLEDELASKIEAVERYAEAVEEQSATKIGHVLHAVNKLADGQPPKHKKTDDWHDEISYR